MNELWLILLAYRSQLLQWLRTRFSIKTPFEYHSDRKIFQKGDLVEATDGTKGRVWRILVKVKTGKPISCCVLWETQYQGQKASIAPLEDKSPKFNPLIRKATE